jgi:hypothetical protein
MTPIGDYQGPPVDHKLPFGWVEMQIPVEVPRSWGENSEKRRNLARRMTNLARIYKSRCAVTDDVAGGQMILTVQQTPFQIENLSKTLAKLQLDDIPGSTEPRPYNRLPSAPERGTPHEPPLPPQQ